MSDPIKTTEGLKVGDVLIVAQYLKPRDGRDPYWWKSFRAILSIDGKRSATLLILKMKPDLDKDVREVYFSDEGFVITTIDMHNVPQGVAAMRMKHVMQGLIKLDGG